MIPSAMEPMFPCDGNAALTDLAVDVIASASHLSGQIQEPVRESIGDLVRSMNCYYSNLIEGHNTHPRDIDAALAGNYSRDPKRRVLQLEARAHIEVQRLIDYGEDPEASPYSPRTSSGFTRSFVGGCRKNCFGLRIRMPVHAFGLRRVNFATGKCR